MPANGIDATAAVICSAPYRLAENSEGGRSRGVEPSQPQVLSPDVGVRCSRRVAN